MPMFKIATDNGRFRSGGDEADEPLEFPDLDAAIRDAQIALGEIARDSMPDGKAARFAVEVADPAGKVVYRATLDFRAWTEREIAAEGATRTNIS